MSNYTGWIKHSFQRYLFVVNPISGARSKDILLSDIEEFCKSRNWEYHIVLTNGFSDKENIQTVISRYQPEVIVAVGGDGTVNLVAQAVAHTEMVMGIIPMGSGNGLSKDLNIPQFNHKSALQILENPTVTGLDSLMANDHFFVHLCDLGFNAHIVKLFMRSGKRGLLSYIKFSIKEFFNYKTFRYEIKTNKGNYKGYAFMITIANSNQFGSNLTINPEGVYDDGIFEIVIIKRFPRKRILGLLVKLIRKRINFSPYCITVKCKEAEIYTKKKKALQYDGEPGGVVNKVNISIQHNSLKVIVPASTVNT
jgi:diacylglycerol kinase (ATP)